MPRFVTSEESGALSSASMREGGRGPRFGELWFLWGDSHNHTSAYTSKAQSSRGFPRSISPEL